MNKQQAHICNDETCVCCAVRFCPFESEDHLFHDGCPTCYQKSVEELKKRKEELETESFKLRKQHEIVNDKIDYLAVLLEEHLIREEFK